jgi:hypothetical protein
VAPSNDRKPGPNPRVTDDEILQIFRDTETPVVTVSSVEERLPVGHRNLLNRLNALWDQDVLNRMDVGPRGRVWWLPGFTTTTADTSIPETQLKRLSSELHEPITVAGTVYEDGDAHPLNEAETDNHDITDESDPTDLNASLDAFQPHDTDGD